MGEFINPWRGGYESNRGVSVDNFHLSRSNFSKRWTWMSQSVRSPASAPWMAQPVRRRTFGRSRTRHLLQMQNIHICGIRDQLSLGKYTWNMWNYMYYSMGNRDENTIIVICQQYDDLWFGMILFLISHDFHNFIILFGFRILKKVLRYYCRMGIGFYNSRSATRPY